ncbi:hypothetical protein DRP77_04485, partial [Candidatus Poribacteria bacterium]
MKSCPYATPFDSWAWRRALSTKFPGMRPIYLGVESGDELLGAMPLFIFRPLPFFKSALSLPWNLFGGPLLKGEVVQDETAIGFALRA